MASITRRGSRYLVRVRRDGFALAAKTFTKKADATAWGRRVEADMESERWISEASKVPTLKKPIAGYRSKVAAKIKGSATYAHRFNGFSALPFAAKPVREVTLFEIVSRRSPLATALVLAHVNGKDSINCAAAPS